MKRKYIIGSLVCMLFATSTSTFAQIGTGWVEYTPDVKVHLSDPKEKLQTFEKAAYVERGDSAGLYASYTYDSTTKTETFKLFGSRANRAEIRTLENYGKVARQFQGYVTISDPVCDQSLIQIWGSTEGATQLMLRGRPKNNGTLCLNQSFQPGTPTLMTNCYNKEVKVNIIHYQQPGETTVGDSMYVYLNDQFMFKFADTEMPTNTKPVHTNYIKYGAYGTVPEDEKGTITVKWRDVRLFKDGKPLVTGLFTGIKKEK